MTTTSTAQPPSWLMHLGDARWVRGHISTFCIGAVLLVCLDLLGGGGDMWAFTAIGMWIMLLVVHIIVVLISRLTIELMADDDEEIVLLPIKDAMIIEPKADPPASWTQASPPETEKTPPASETVSWSVATDVAQARRNRKQDKDQ